MMGNFLNFAGNTGTTFTDHGTGGGTSFTLPVAATTNSVMLSIGGIMQQQVTDYSVSNTTVTTTTAVTSGVEVLSWIIHKQGTAPALIDNSIVTAKIADNQVTTAKIADNNVTGAKIAMGSDAAGDILYYNGTDYARLAKGTASQQLRMNSGATAPEWATISTGPTLGTPLTLSSTANHTWNSSNSGIKSGITYFIIHFSQVLTATGCTIKIQLGDSGGIETSGYVSTGLRTSDNNAATATDSMIIHAQDTSDTIEGTFKCYLLDSSTNLWVSDHTLRDGGSDAQLGGGKKALSGELTQVKFVTSTGTLSSGSMNILCG